MDTYGREVTVSSNGTHLQSYLSWEDLERTRITHKSNVRDIEPIVRIGDSIFGARGDISVIGGLPKAGKTAMSVYIIGTALKQFDIDTDTLSIRSIVSTAPVIYIDTEQHPSDTNKLEKSIRKFIGTEETPSNLFTYSIRSLGTVEKKLHHVRSTFNYFKDKAPHLFIIDGLADLVRNPNDIAESFALISEFMAIAENTNTCIIFFLHENPGQAQKLRGNLGSEIERKCYGAITVRKDKKKGIHWIEPRMLRGSADFDNIYFKYDINIGRMRSLDEAERNEAEKSLDQTEVQRNKLHELALRVFKNDRDLQLRHTDVVSNIIQCYPNVFSKMIKETQAKTKVQAMAENGFIVKDNSGFYSLKKEDE